MSEFKKGWKTTESCITFPWLLASVVVSFFAPDLTKWSYVVSVVSCSFIIARSIFKRNRQILIHDGHKTSELKYAIAGLLLLVYAVSVKKLSLENSVICSGLIVIVFNLGRGYTKGLGHTSSRTMIIP